MLPEARAAFWFLVEESKRSESRFAIGLGQRRGINQTPGAVNQKLFQRLGAGNKTAHTSNRFRQSAHRDFNFSLNSKMFRAAATVFSKHSSGVSVINHE